MYKKLRSLRRGCALFLALVMCAGLLQLPALAAEEDSVLDGPVLCTEHQWDAGTAIEGGTRYTCTVEGCGATKEEKFPSSEENTILDENRAADTSNTLLNEPAPQADEPRTEAERLQAAAENGGSYTLTENVTASIEIPAGVTFSLNLGGYTLTNEDGNHTIINNGALTITGSGTVDNVSHGKTALYNEGTANVDGCTIARSKEAGVKGSNGGNSYYFIQNNGTMTLTNVTAESKGRFSSMVRNGALDEAGQVIATGTLTIEGEGTRLVNGNTAVKNECGTLTVNGGTLTSTNNYSVVNYGTAYLKGGDYTGSDGYSLYNYIGNDWPEGETVISGGKFHANDKKKNTAYLAPTVVQNEGGEVVARTEYDDDAVAKIGTAVYSSLQDAIKAAGTTAAEIVMLQNDTHGATIEAGQNITLNVPEGVTLSNEETLVSGSWEQSVLINKGKLTLTGGGNVESKKNGNNFCLWNDVGGVANLNGCTLTTGNGDYVVLNQSNLTIDGAKLYKPVTGSFSVISNGNGATNPVLTVNSGEIIDTSTFGAPISNCGTGTVTVNGGKIAGWLPIESSTGGTVTINGGEFTKNAVRTDKPKNEDYALFYGSAYTINGGKFFNEAKNPDGTPYEGEIKVIRDGGSMVVTGGTFFEDVEKRGYCAKGYISRDNNDGTWTVIVDKSEAVARIGETYYVTLQAAVDAAKTGDTVELLKTVKTDALLKVEKGKTVNLDLGGHTYQRETGTYVVANSGTLNISNGTIAGNYHGAYNDGTLNMESGTIETTGYYGIVCTDKSVTNIHGTAKVIGNWQGILADEGASADTQINVYGNAEISAEESIYTNCAITAYGATVKIYDEANLRAGSGINTNGKLEILGNVRIESTAVTGTAVGLYGGADAQIKGGTLIADTYGVSSQGLDKNAGAKCVITAGDISAKKIAIYWPGRDSELSISDGVKATGKEGGSAMTIRGGKINVTGGTFVAEHSDDPDTWEKALTGSQGWYNGSTIIIVDGHDSYKLEEVKISGGTFNSSGKPALLYVNMAAGATAESGCLNVTGGLFTTAENSNVVVEAYAVPGKDTAKKVNAKILAGGDFSSDVDAYCAADYVSHKISTPNYWNVHRQSSGWHSNVSEHWQGCDAANCIEGRKNVGPHTFGDWVTVTAAQVGVPGLERHVCTVCGYAPTRMIAALSGGSGGSGGGGGGGGTGGGTTTINEGEVPLAGDLQLNREDHFAYIKGYEDGTVRPNNPLTRAQVATIYYRLLTDLSRELYFQETNDFTDVPDDFWACKAISTLTNAGIINGFQDGTFRPNAYITRAQFAAMTARFESVIPGLENPFADVSESHWARDEIAYAVSRGWVSGEGSFRPQENITRVETMDFINNVLDRHVDEEGILKGVAAFTDVPVTDPSYYVVAEATNSHDYSRRAEGQSTENWTELRDDPVWEE